MNGLLELEIGNISNLKGNAIVYWLNKPNTIAEEIIAINFVLSALPLQDNLVATTFPYVIFKGRKEFMFYVNFSKADIIYAGECNIEQKEGIYPLNNQQYKQLNNIIKRYLFHYRNKMEKLNEMINPLDMINVMFDCILKIENQQSSHKPTVIKKIMEEQISSFFNLEEVKNSISKNDLAYFLKMMRGRHKNKYDVLKLYLKKYLAILDEEYEEALLIKNKIMVLIK